MALWFRFKLAAQNVSGFTKHLSPHSRSKTDRFDGLGFVAYDSPSSLGQPCVLLTQQTEPSDGASYKLDWRNKKFALSLRGKRGIELNVAKNDSQSQTTVWLKGGRRVEPNANWSVAEPGASHVAGRKVLRRGGADFSLRHPLRVKLMAF